MVVPIEASGSGVERTRVDDEHLSRGPARRTGPAVTQGDLPANEFVDPLRGIVWFAVTDVEELHCSRRPRGKVSFDGLAGDVSDGNAPASCLPSKSGVQLVGEHDRGSFHAPIISPTYASGR